MFILQIQNSHSDSFIYFELLQVSAIVKASRSGSRCSFQNQILLFLSLNKKNISMCFNTLSDELIMQISRLPTRLMDYITYGFFESNNNKANQKVHSTQKKIIQSQSVIKGIVCVQEMSLLSPLFDGSLSAPLR